VRGPRPPWYRTARSIGGVPWVPFEVARALQEQLDAHRARLADCEREILAARDTMQRLAGQARQQQVDSRGMEQLREVHRQRMAALEGELARAEERLGIATEQAARARAEADTARVQARVAAERLADCEPTTSDEAARIQRLTEDLARIRERTEQEVAAARRAERSASLHRLAAIHDDLMRGLQALPDQPDSPWLQGYRAILQQLQQLLALAGATPFGERGDAFDPELHEAVGTAPARDEHEFDRVVGVVRVGFALEDGTLLRPAQVVVGA
jgi:molecular chaperone GrpE